MRERGDFIKQYIRPKVAVSRGPLCSWPSALTDYPQVRCVSQNPYARLGSCTRRESNP